MKPLFPTLLLTILLVSLGALTSHSYAQCGTSTTRVAVNFDWQYFDTIPGVTNGSFRFMMGKSSMELKWASATNSFRSVTAAHTGETNSFGAGGDLKFDVSAGTDTMIFQDEMDSLRFSIYDVDIRTRVTITAFKADNSSQNVILTKANPTGPLVLGGTATAPYGENTSTTNIANTSIDGTLNIRIAGLVKKVVISITKTSGSVVDSMYLSDITGFLCNNKANWSANYQAASTPEAGQPTYTLASYNNNLYVVDITNKTSSILFTDASLTSINSLAYDPVRQVVYYTSNVRNYSNRAIYKYDIKTGTKSTFVSDVLSLGVQIRAITGSGLGSAGACYYDGCLFIATDANLTVGDATTIYRIDIDSASGTALRASRFWSRQALTASARLFDWSDFIFKNGIAYCFNQSNPSPTKFGAFHVSLNNQDTTAGYSTAVRVQMSMDYAENVYHMGNYGLLELYNGNGTFTSLGSYPRVNAADTIITDGAESFKYPYDFSRDSASYGTAFHLFNTSQNLRLGSSVSYAPTTTLDNPTNDNDGVSTFPELTVANSSYSIDVNLANTTGSSAVLYGFIDFNGDGDFDDPGERSEPLIVIDGAVTGTLTWTGLTGGTVGPTRMRLRLAPTDAEARFPGGYASNGETEDFGITIGMSSLPVELIRFTGEKTAAGTVQLDWSTASEFNNDHFEVQRSNDFNSWEPIGQVKGHGNSSSLVSYTFEDKDPKSGNNYYRLKQVDFDKKSELSNVINVRFDGEETAKNNGLKEIEVTVYPNPAQEDFWIRSDRDFSESGVQQVEVYNLSGSVVYTADLEGSQHQVDLREQPSGLYLVRLGEKSYKVFKN